MIYTYDVILHNSQNITIQRACLIADTLQSIVEPEGSHLQGVGFGDRPSDIKITFETSFKMDDLFSIIYDSRAELGYNDFSIYYSEGFNKVAKAGYGA